METMKGILKFNLNDPDEARSHRAAVKADEMAIVLWEIIHNIRRRTAKREDVTEEAMEVIDDLYKEIYDLLDEQGIIIDDLTI